MTVLILIVALVIAYYVYKHLKNKRIEAEKQEMFENLSSAYNNAFSQGDIPQIQKTAKQLINYSFVSQGALNTVYEQSLTLLKNNPDLKPFALECGRKKYAHFRPDGSPTTYDESAIMNDINAAL